MATVTDSGFIENIANRGADHPRQRAELCDQVADAEERLVEAVTDYAASLVGELEFYPDRDLTGVRDRALKRLITACSEYAEGVEAAITFLGGDR